MSDTPAGPGWWQASDGRWYPPAAGTPAPPPPSMPTPAPLPPSLAKGTPPPPASVDATTVLPTGGPGPYPGPYPPGATPPPPAGGYGPPTAPPGAPGGPPSGAYPPAGGYGPPPGGGYPPPPPPGGGYPGGGYPPPKKSGSGAVIAVVAVIAVLVLVGGATAFFLTRDSGDDDPDPPSTTTEDDGPDAEPLLLQQASDPGPDAFGASFADGDLPELSGAALSAAESSRAQLTSDGASGALVGTGDEPGLYGGSRDNRVCDAMAIADFLEGDAAKGAAFAEVLGIETGDIRDYIGSLTAVVLASDTWVTNHGFADGEATSFQAVLEAGTAVLVDDTGVPRVRCSCGNPLTPPDREGHSTEATDGDAWEGYEADQVTVVEPGTQLSTITLLDIESGEQFDRAVGAGQTGDVQVTLQWTGDADLDLHVFDPADFEIYFGDEVSDSGGELDVDVIPGCDTPPESHTENVFWATGTAPSGDYRVVIESYDGCGEEPTEFDVQVVVDGVVEISESGSVAPEEESTPFPFTV